MEELDLKELFEIFWSRKIYIGIITLVFVIVGVIYSYFFVEPDYKSETSLLLVKQGTDNTTTSTVTTSDITLNKTLISTYSELIRSEIVLDKVIENLGMEDETVDDLKEHVTVSSVKDTELMQITVTNKNAKNAQVIASEIVSVFTEEVKRIYNIDNITIVGEAKIIERPYNINHIKDIAIFMFIGLVASAAYAFVANMLDTTVKGKDALERKTGLSVLTEIPLCNFNETKVAKKGGRK